MIKSAEEIIDKIIYSQTDGEEYACISKEDCIKAMNEYAIQFMTFKECYECNGVTGNAECQTCTGNGKYILLPTITTTGT